ncbi:MAG: phospho-sugar mutase [Oscillospiraceae bacterium]|jgi:phosphoglucomutase|nr:phospho-sugar mutase [Oscillospiraceae bacterium]
MTAMAEYRRWLTSHALSESEKAELRALEGNAAEIEERFSRPLAFGTAGLRGIMGAGLGRINVHTVRHVTQALANLILREGPEAAARGVAIACDCRLHAEEYARQAACVLAGRGITALLFDELRPTPELSFAIRAHRCVAGINITASHNPKEYNGYKVYWSDGAQIPPAHADMVAREMASLDPLESAAATGFDEALRAGRIRWLGAETDRAFLDCALAQSVAPDAVRAVADDCKLVYTPFHGAGYRLVPEALAALGFRHVLCEPEQMKIDGNFPTVVSPNPENAKSFERAVALARRHDVDLVIGTDPDADRVGVMVRDRAGGYVPLTGNQMGVLLMDYLIRARRAAGTLPARPAVVQTIVTTRMTHDIAKKNDIALFETFTGFKFIAEVIAKLDASGSHQFLMGFEESYGYLIGSHARDKDAVTASLLIAEMAAWYRRQEMTLFDALQALYETYGHYREATLNLVMPGLAGLARMQALMDDLRGHPPAGIAGTPVEAVCDYLSGRRFESVSGAVSDMELSGSDVLGFALLDGTRLLVRPSGTEPKVKVYIQARGADAHTADDTVARFAQWAKKLV